MSNSWMNQFLRLKCAGDVVSLFSSTREVSESMAAFGALFRLRGFPKAMENQKVMCIVPGYLNKGTAPLIACRTRWNVAAYTPLPAQTDFQRLFPIAMPYDLFRPKALTCVQRAKELDYQSISSDIGVVVAVGPRHPLDNYFELLRSKRRILVALVENPHNIGVMVPFATPKKYYVDRGVEGPCKTVLIWDEKR